MKEILEHARVPQTKGELITWVSAQHECAVEDISESVDFFLNRMIKFGALVLEDSEQVQRPSGLIEELEQTRRFDDFVLLERIGKNRSVAIYKCLKEGNTDTMFSIKILISRESRSYFFREAAILNLLPPHPNVRNCFAATRNRQGVPYLLLEYVDGNSISDPRIKRDLSLVSKYKVGAEVMSSINHLHCHGILHGDIHASNFLVDANCCVHLIDLGMAYKESEEVSHGGIPRYMPPERMPDHNYVFSKKQGDFVSEVFQIGICLYLLLSGKYPFEGLLLKDLAQSIKYINPPALTETLSGEVIAPEISNIVFKALEKIRR
jgi:serine/threonine protein kinase